MIVPMKKYSFLVYHKEYDQFLEQIRNIGVLHVIEKDTGLFQEQLQEFYRKITQADKVIKFIESVEKSTEAEFSETDAERIVDLVVSRQLQLEQLNQKVFTLQKEHALAQPWGDFSSETINRLNESGIDVFLFTCNEKSFKKEWLEQFSLEMINQIDDIVYLVYFKREDEIVFDIPIEPHVFPERALHEITADIEQTQLQINEIVTFFSAVAAKVEILNNYRKDLQLRFDTQGVKSNTLHEADNKLMVFEGWIPANKTEELNQLLQSQSVYFESAEPLEEDDVPILLKNNWFIRLFEPIGDLYTLPKYKELDITVFFGPFFLLFFGFCLGDVGYGLLILFATIYFKKKVSPSIKPILTLGMVLGISTIVMGVFSGTFFGINLLETDFLFFPSLRFAMLDSKQLMTLSLVIGFIQIIFGMSVKAANQIIFSGLRSALATLGWIFLIVSLVANYYLTHAIFNTTGIIFIAVSFPFIFLLNSPGKNIFINFGLGLWDSYGMATGILGDVLSYIRLFALGLSSAVLGSVFNQMALQVGHTGIPVLSQFFMVLILVFGHSLNLGLSALGSFVHPLRLTFVEFYKNAGFAGGGIKYNPFKN
jgi:V/A-type H+/Na+-transporting ATPase subunit I